MKDNIYKKKLKKKNNKMKLEEKEERIKEIEKENEKKRKEILKKIEKITIRKEEFDKKKEQLLHKNKSLQEEHFKKLIKNRLLITQYEDNRRENILLDEAEKLNRGVNKDYNVETHRIRAHISLISNQIEFEEELKKFKKKLNYLQDESIQKKNKQQQYNIYKEKLRKEKEKRRKEEEAKLNKSS